MKKGGAPALPLELKDRINDKTAFRAGYARYAVPWVAIHPETGGLPTNGFSQSTSLLSPLEGTPRTLLSDPYPTGGANPNPVSLPVGNSLGRYQDLGNGVNFWEHHEDADERSLQLHHSGPNEPRLG